VRVEFDGSHVHTVVLSRRNLLSLLAKLDGHPPDSACTIYNQDIVVVAEPDEVHYADRDAGGRMHPKTESAISEQHTCARCHYPYLGSGDLCSVCRAQGLD